MTDTLLEQLLERLVRKLELDEPDGDTLALLEDELRDAEGELTLYLGWEAGEVAERLPGKAVELAALYYRQDVLAERGLSSYTYSEGQVSERESYQTPGQIKEAAGEVFRSLARYRRVSC